MGGRSFLLLGQFLITLQCIPWSDGKTFEVKIVEEPSNYWNQPQQEEDILVARVKPANFSGPPQFRSLLGKCFDKSDEVYQYKFCPFSNVTQHEISLRWNPYNGILGVWQEWEIADNTYTAMMMKEGEKCGSVSRLARIVFECATKNQLKNVSEPRTCEYLMVFQTPLVCNSNVMRVYPTLTAELRDAWDELEGEFSREEITQKGYNKELTKIFQRADLIQSSSDKITSKGSKSSFPDNTGNSIFNSIEQCSEAYKLLKDEVEGLRTLLMLREPTEDNKTNHVPAVKTEFNAWSRYKLPLYNWQKRKKAFL